MEYVMVGIAGAMVGGSVQPFTTQGKWLEFWMCQAAVLVAYYAGRIA